MIVTDLNHGSLTGSTLWLLSGAREWFIPVITNYVTFLPIYMKSVPGNVKIEAIISTIECPVGHVRQLCYIKDLYTASWVLTDVHINN